MKKKWKLLIHDKNVSIYYDGVAWIVLGRMNPRFKPSYMQKTDEAYEHRKRVKHFIPNGPEP